MLDCCCVENVLLFKTVLVFKLKFGEEPCFIEEEAKLFILFVLLTLLLTDKLFDGLS